MKGWLRFREQNLISLGVTGVPRPLRHLAQFDEPPASLQEGIFNQLFSVAEIANFSPAEQTVYQES